MSSLSRLHTPCKNCYFAEYTNNTQTGCSMGLLDEYRKTDHIEIKEAYDHEKEFYIVDNKQCVAYKEEKYFELRNIENDKKKRIEYVRDLLNLKYVAVINCYTTDLTTLSDILKQIKQADVHPYSIVICLNENSLFQPHEYYKVLNKSGIKSKWKIKNVSHVEQDHITTVHEIINLGAENCNFVLSVNGNFDNLTTIINTANDITYKKFKRFIVLSNESKETILFNKFVYKSGLTKSHDIITHYEEYTTI